MSGAQSWRIVGAARTSRCRRPFKSVPRHAALPQRSAMIAELAVLHSGGLPCVKQAVA
ncbi:hypothetical protein KCP71_16780 [Salmonella enterica subsp. enterica]|nr:hypothetical protein KCP71_16780 [Salmonella enterica subsp. enterica]